MKPWRLALLGPLLWLSACAGPRALSDGPPSAGDVPAPLRADAAPDEIKDAVPRAEPRSKYGNPPSYSVHGKTYYVLASAENFRERGRASWYGRKFHGRRTSSGEPYDMYAMTAAHKTLPLPCYVRVHNLDNGREAIVRVNDRGPFHDGRVIDLSYAAALKLGVVGAGSANVEIETIDPRAPRTQFAASTPGPPAVQRPPVPINDTTPHYLQAGSFSDPVNAVALREQLGSIGIQQVEIRVEEIADSHMHRVLIGPFAQESELEATRDQLLVNRFSAIPVIR
ncbi:septal ring lytic transglycosylase RlpA family protein [Algiphilus sp. W345]|uniref:Endolytic peptidoglycan transglycosylase RlpA n=1 Tax=Banduia mediterranea TaxID=3075609 RepID=A0ABU2WHW6_9GAMM|nr:septal ring lytic transglycosylase RlpA family protein [Algiphilus sp. W345]MDT0497452.1 septal ring lytic transglycosylase RlpA family protein [Algiphilus sp. W345]